MPPTSQYMTVGPNSTLPEYNGAGGVPGVVAPYAPNTIKDLMNKQLDLAKQYRANIPQMVNRESADYNKSAKANLASQIQGTRQGFNSRGLLRSGMRRGAEYGQAAQTSSDMANNRYAANQNALTNADQLEQNAYNSGLLFTGNAPNLGASALSGTGLGVGNDIQNMENTGTVTNAAGGAFGKIIGSMLANKYGNTAGGTTSMGNNSGVGNGFS